MISCIFFSSVSLYNYNFLPSNDFINVTSSAYLYPHPPLSVTYSCYRNIFSFKKYFLCKVLSFPFNICLVILLFLFFFFYPGNQCFKLISSGETPFNGKSNPEDMISTIILIRFSKTRTSLTLSPPLVYRPRWYKCVMCLPLYCHKFHIFDFFNTSLMSH